MLCGMRGRHSADAMLNKSHQARRRGDVRCAYLDFSSSLTAMVINTSLEYLENITFIKIYIYIYIYYKIQISCLIVVGL